MWNHIMKLFTLLHYSPLACLELWVDLQPIRDFYHCIFLSCIFIMHCLFAKCWLWIMWIFQMLSPFILQYRKIRFVNIPTDLIRKICEIWICQAYGDGYRVFQYLNLYLKAQILLLQQVLSLVFFEVTGSHCLFLRKCLPDTQI